MQKEHFEVLLESVDHKMQLILEGVTALDRKIDGVKEQLTERADLTDFKIQAVIDRLDAVEQRLDNKIDSVEQNLERKLDAIASDLHSHRTDTEAHHGIYRVKEG